RIDIAPTKSNLRRVKSELSFATEGFDLLNQKREILVMEIVKTIKSIKDVEAGLEAELSALYHRYRKAAVESGTTAIALKSLSEKINYLLEEYSSRLMGITITGYTLKPGPLEVNSPMSGTGASYDMIKAQSVPVLELVARYASLAKKVFLLSAELKKVQRRVNALEKIFIPAYEDTKKYISDRLEEIDREEIFIKKLIGRRKEQDNEQGEW
ncbi:MAG TPA: V-type ATP synthase subunit D, partial [Spirochaetota bacterium]|nr:V-type ATP synthase subunit D [Spirochaetota bacterium]